jgi:threonine aldolase
MSKNPTGRNFKSDNTAPVCARIMEAIAAANVGWTPSYGADPWTAALDAAVSGIFGREVAVYPVTTGTAANALALAHLVPSYGAVYCHEAAHIVVDECAAPEFFAGGAKLLTLASADGKITAPQLDAAAAFALEMGVHHVKPAALSLTQATERGTVYRLGELADLAAVAARLGIPVHMDGARFANALAHLGCSPAEATWKCGVDVLSLGATKNGAMCAEAVVFFDPARARDFERRRKQGGHLWSKLRFVSAQLLAYFEAGLWLDNARHANSMAAVLSTGLKDLPGAALLHPVEANEVFVSLPERAVVALEARAFEFYRWPVHGWSEGVPIRLVTSYATAREAVEEFLAVAKALAVEGSRAS